MSINILNTCWHHRSLIFELVKREFSARYRGTVGGVFWSFAQPLFLFAVYIVVFGLILKTRWGIGGDAKEYALMVFAGLIIFNLFSDCLKNAPTLITANPNFVKKIVFPLELLPIVMVISNLANAMVSTIIWLWGYILLFGLPNLTVIYFPIVLAAFLPFLIGMAWLLAAIGVVVRDISHISNLVSQAILFLSPVFFSVQSAPKSLQMLLMVNPLTFIMDQFRQVMFFGFSPNMKGLVVYFIFSLACSALSLLAFRRLRPIFSDIV